MGTLTLRRSGRGAAPPRCGPPGREHARSYVWASWASWASCASWACLWMGARPHVHDPAGTGRVREAQEPPAIPSFAVRVRAPRCPPRPNRRSPRALDATRATPELHGEIASAHFRNEKARGSNPRSSTTEEPRPTSANAGLWAGFRRRRHRVSGVLGRIRGAPCGTDWIAARPVRRGWTRTGRSDPSIGRNPPTRHQTVCTLTPSRFPGGLPDTARLTAT
jgi:hypothetical protein